MGSYDTYPGELDHRNCGESASRDSAFELITEVSVGQLRHHTLVAWQRADDLFIKLHKISVEVFPALERFALSAQLRRAAYSVPANIAEGFARRHRRERLHFLNIAEGSLSEASYCVHAAWRLGYINDSVRAELEIDLDRVGAPLIGLIRKTRTMPDVIP